jgi:hypothetical protein
VTIKAEQEGGGAATPAERAVEQDDLAAAGSQPLPSIVVDPSMREPEASRDLAAAKPPESDEPTERLSVADAERFAATFRPSWDPPAPTRASIPGAPITPIPARSQYPSVPAFEAEPDIDVRGLPGLADRRRGMMIAAAAVSGFVVLGALALMSSRSAPAPAHKPEPAAAAQVAAAAEAPVAAAAPQPEPTPAAAPAIAPSAAVEAPSAAPPAAAPAEPVNAPAAALARAEAAPPQLPAPEPASVHIRVSASPSDAELLIDGARVTNPYEAEERKGAKLRMRVQASGYHSHDETLSMDQDRTIAVRLDKVRAPKPSRPVHAPIPHITHAPVAHHASTPGTPRASTGAGFVTESPY